MMIANISGERYEIHWDGKFCRDKAGHKWFVDDAQITIKSDKHGSTTDWQADRPETN